MLITPEQFKELLVQNNLISSEKFDQSLKEAKNKEAPIDVFVSESNLIEDTIFGQLMAKVNNIEYVDLFDIAIDQDALELIPASVTKSKSIIIFKQDENFVHLATFHPEDKKIVSSIKKLTGKNVKIYYATPKAINNQLANYKEGIKAQAAELLSKLSKYSGSKENTDETGEAVIKLVDLIMEKAHTDKASDIHIEPLKKEVVVRLRIDGVMHEILRYPKKIQENVSSRIKIMSKLSIDEHAAPQDGRFSHTIENSHFDVRVSILPTISGENIVMRILAGNSRRLYLEDIGMLEKDLEKLKRAAEKPYGMILTVGPTGAGKTTTLYAVLHTLNNPEVNIMTIEDPVEYEVDEIRQTQVHKKKKVTFASGLRSIVRQDPDIIMVGEIRDEETANIAVNSAMTGHLVLSTLHANDAPTTFPRLLDMGVEPFLVASSVNVIISQRLVRKICENCKEKNFDTVGVKKILEVSPHIVGIIKEMTGKENLDKIEVYHGKGCKHCANTGYSGRMGIFEVLEVNEEIQSLISQKANSKDIYEKAREYGMTTMIEDGIRKMLMGTTTLEEVIRATKF